MNHNEFRLAFRTMTFLNAQAGNPRGCFTLRTRPARRLLLWHPEAIDQLFRADGQMRHSASRTMSPILGRRSLLWAEGSRHRTYRRLLGPALRGRELAARRDSIADTVCAAVDALEPGAVISLPAWTRTVTLHIIGQILFGRVDTALLGQFTDWINRELGSRGRTLAHRYLGHGASRASADLDRKLLLAADNAETPALTAILSTAIGPHDEVELRDQLVSLLFAGHETTASATAWTLYWLDRDHHVREDIVDELAATDDTGADPTQVPLLHATVQEALRLSPPATVAGNRLTTADIELNGEAVAAGSVIMPSIYLAHRQPASFPDPLRFDPGRFRGKPGPTTGYLPFGGGVRRCLGSELAMLEIRMIVAAVLRRRRLRCVNPEAGVPQMRGHAMAPAARLRMVVTT